MYTNDIEYRTPFFLSLFFHLMNADIGRNDVNIVCPVSTASDTKDIPLFIFWEKSSCVHFVYRFFSVDLTAINISKHRKKICLTLVA